MSTTRRPSAARNKADAAFQAPTLPTIDYDPDILRVEIPREMQTARRWLLWRYDQPEKPGGKPRKIPHYADGSPRSGRLDSPQDRARLVTLDACLEALLARPGYGPGFALGPDDSGQCWQGIDLDHVDARPGLALLADELPGYVERSPSGGGVHAVGYGAGFETLGPNSTGIEAYAKARFFTVTGAAIRGGIEDLDPFVRRVLAPRHGQAKGATPGNGACLTLAPEQIADLRSALFSLRSDDRDLWVRIGLALHELGDVGRGLWLAWSATSDKFDPKDAARVWGSMRPDRTGWKAVLEEAQRQGWTNPKARRKAGAGSEEAIDTNAALVERPSFAVHDDFSDFGKPGLYWHGIKGDEIEDVWICSPLYALAMTASDQDTDHGLLLRFRNAAGRWREWCAPMAMLAGSGEALRAELLHLGVRIDQGAHRLLNNYLMSRYPERRVLAATSTGWHLEGRCFVLPARTIGTGDVRYQSEHAGHDEFTVAGTLEDWRGAVAAACIGNPILALAVSAALAGPLLARLHRGGGGFHLVGDSSTGKSTALAAAASVWGGAGFVRTWRATGNGLEGIAAALNDTALILDEISEADPRELGAVVYAVGNGVGKSRASRTGSARPVKRWRVMLLSSGERTLAAAMQEGGKRTKAGQEARLLDVPCTRRHGIFDQLHAAASGRAMADSLRTATARYHGWAGPEFVRHLIDDTTGDLGELLATILARPDFASGSGLEGRAAGTFALAGLAGELATDYGITGWPDGAALDSAAMGYRLWREHRGEGQTETRQILEAVGDFLARHGDSRFSHVTGADQGPVVRDRAGWYRDIDEGRVYLMHAAGLREASQGFDFARVLEALDSAGWITDQGGASKSKLLKVAGRVHRVYAIAPKFEAAE